MTEEQIEYMVSRFLDMPLPEDFNPDNGISFEPLMNKGTPQEMKRDPYGTNLFEINQVTQMVRYLIDGMPSTKTTTNEYNIEYTVDGFIATPIPAIPETLINPRSARSLGASDQRDSVQNSEATPAEDKMTQTAHIPTIKLYATEPDEDGNCSVWRIDIEEKIPVIESLPDPIAAFIVKAVNCHDGLIENLKLLLSETGRLKNGYCDVKHPSDRAIFKATEMLAKAGAA